MFYSSVWELQPPLPSLVQRFTSFGWEADGGRPDERLARRDKGQVMEWAVRLAQSHDFPHLQFSQPASIVCSPWAKEVQTHWLDDSGCHSPVQISVIVSSLEGWGMGPAHNSGRRRMKMTPIWAQPALQLFTLCVQPSREGSLAMGGRAICGMERRLFLSLTHGQREDREDPTEQIARVLFRSRSRLWLVVFWLNPACELLFIDPPPCLLWHRRRP